MEKFNSVKELISIVADGITIITLIWAFFYGIIKKNKNLLGLRINEFIGFILKLALLTFFSILIVYLSYAIYLLILTITKFNGSNTFWEKEYPLPHVLGYLISGAIGLTLIWLVGTIIWTGSLKYARSLWDITKLKNLFSEFLSDKELLIDKAIYQATPDNYLDVTTVVQKMVANNSLIITSSNSLAGDPLRYTIKNLIISYRFGKENEQKTVTVPETQTLTLKYKDIIEIK
jgi:hypothetical protein